MAKSQKPKDYYFIDVDVRTMKIVACGETRHATHTGATDDPLVHRVFLTKGQFNKLRTHLTWDAVQQSMLLAPRKEESTDELKCAFLTAARIERAAHADYRRQRCPLRGVGSHPLRAWRRCSLPCRSTLGACRWQVRRRPSCKASLARSVGRPPRRSLRSRPTDRSSTCRDRPTRKRIRGSSESSIGTAAGRLCRRRRRTSTTRASRRTASAWRSRSTTIRPRRSGPYELGGATAVRRLTFGGQNRFPIWTNDGERIVFQSDRDGDRGIYWQRADGASAAERVTKAGPDDAHVPEAWSPRGDGFLFRIVHGLAHTLQFYSLSQKAFVPFGGIDSRAPTAAAFSPDGRWVAYENGEYGGADRTIFVQPFPATGARYEVPSVGASGRRHPLWSPDGRELFFTTGGEVNLIVAGVRTQPSLTFTNPIVLPKSSAWMDSFADAAREWDVLPDGQHFIGKMWARNASVGRASQPREVDVVSTGSTN